MKKLFLLVALTGAAVAAYCVTTANASTTEAQQAKADVYKMSSLSFVFVRVPVTPKEKR